jgi:type I restriction enzyme M protein
MSKFENFTNPFQNPSDIPVEYRRSSRLEKLFKADDTYMRPIEDPVTMWAIDILHKHYKVPLEAISLEVTTNFGNRAYTNRVDVVINDDRYTYEAGNLDVAFIVLEAKCDKR